MTDQPTELFWEVRAAALAHGDVAVGTMTGFSCLRVSARSSPPATTDRIGVGSEGKWRILTQVHPALPSNITRARRTGIPQRASAGGPRSATGIGGSGCDTALIRSR
jgi:hypothetical protein